MSFELQRIIESKRRYREKLAARPIAEKLALLDQLRESALAIRRSQLSRPQANPAVRETPGEYRTNAKSAGRKAASPNS